MKLKREIFIPDEKPYVYGLIDHEGNVFYIGKGRNKRLFQHETEAKRGKPGKKCERIRGVIEAGYEIRYVVFGVFETDEEACQEEIALIADFDGLTNLTKGGEGRWLCCAKAVMMRRAKRLLNKPASYGIGEGHRLYKAVAKEAEDPSPNVATYKPGIGVVFSWEL